MKRVIIILFALLPIFAAAQNEGSSDGLINKGSGILYFEGRPNFDPTPFTDASEFAIDLNTKKVYVYSGSGSVWNRYNAIDTLSTLADTANVDNRIGQLVYVNGVDQFWTVNSAGSWEVLSGGGTNDQTAAEVPATDAGNYFVGTELEAITQELGYNTQYQNEDFVEAMQATQNKGLIYARIDNDSVNTTYIPFLIDVVVPIEEDVCAVYQFEEDGGWFLKGGAQIYECVDSFFFTSEGVNKRLISGTLTGPTGPSAWYSFGSEISFIYEGYGFRHRSYADNRGAIWQYTLYDIYGDSIDVANVDTYRATAGNISEVLFTDWPKGTYRVRGLVNDTNPSSTDNRGWLSDSENSSLISRSADQASHGITIAREKNKWPTNVIKNILAPDSYLEYAIRATPTGSGLSSEWYPDHGVVDMQPYYSTADSSFFAYVDGIAIVEKQFSYRPMRDLVLKSYSYGVEKRQVDSLTAKIESYTHISSNTVENRIDFEWLDTMDITTGYSFMFPTDWDEAGDTLYTNAGDTVALGKRDGSSTILSNKATSFLIKSNSDDYGASATILNPKRTFLNDFEYQKQFRVDFRVDGVQKIYLDCINTGVNNVLPGTKYQLRYRYSVGKNP